MMANLASCSSTHTIAIPLNSLARVGVINLASVKEANDHSRETLERREEKPFEAKWLRSLEIIRRKTAIGLLELPFCHSELFPFSVAIFPLVFFQIARKTGHLIWTKWTKQENCFRSQLEKVSSRRSSLTCALLQTSFFLAKHTLIVSCTLPVLDWSLDKYWKHNRV